jgi:hypothetical protein
MKWMLLMGKTGEASKSGKKKQVLYPQYTRVVGTAMPVIATTRTGTATRIGHDDKKVGMTRL